MRKMLRVSALCLALILLGAVGAWADTLINFDGVPDGTVIDTLYAGVTFSCFSSRNACPGNANTGDVYARNSSVAFSPDNIVSTLATGVPGTQDNTTGAIRVHFATAQSFVSIEDYLFQAAEGAGTGGYGYLQAYDSTLHLLGQVDDTQPAGLNTFTLLSFSSGSANITDLLLGDVQGANIISAFDDLCFSSTSTTSCSAGGGGGSVPEPGTLSLFGLTALVAVGLRKRRIPDNS